MQDLTVIDIQDDALIVIGEGGERYRVVVDDEVRGRLRRSRSDNDDAARVSPREVQAHIRSGLSAADVAEMTGASLEYIERFEGPIVAEREHIVATALAVPVRGSVEADDEESTFGGVLRKRLASISAIGERWASWREPEAGWIVKLSFTADEIDHDARWSFDPRTQALDPLNAEAITLSQQGELREGLIPRLRAVTPTPVVDTTRFDSGAFVFEDEEAEHTPTPGVRPQTGVNNSIAISAIKRADERVAEQNHTADLLEALRRRRGERESVELEEPEVEVPEERAMHVVDLPLDPFDHDLVEAAVPEPVGEAGSQKTSEKPLEPSRPSGADRGGKRGRASIPSWDEIVFGARRDDD